MKNHRSALSVLVAAVALSGIPAMQASAAAITQWDFGTIGLQAAPYNSPAPTTGTGTASMLGMTNAYNAGNTASGDVVQTAGTAVPAFTEKTWRIRGAQLPAGHNGWATHLAGAAQYTQGIELDASTAGFSNIQFSFDWYSTNSGIRDLQFQYNTNVGNAGGWTNFGGTSLTGTYIATPNDYYTGTATPTINVDLSTIAGANNDPNFGVRLVSAYDSTGNIPNEYASATLLSGATQIYNGTSGNWRFGPLSITGTAVPEPTTLGLVGVSVLGLLARRCKV